MGRKRYYYDSKGRSRGFSSDEAPGSRNLKALLIALPLAAIVTHRSGSDKQESPQESAEPSNVSVKAYEVDGANVYVASGVANLRYETKVIDTPIFGQLAPGDRIRGVPIKGADSREWIMIKDGPNAGSFVWAGNLKLAR